MQKDDYISENTVKSLITFFDKHQNEIDIVAYPLYYVTNDKVISHDKNSIFKKTGIYNANHLNFYPMSTINVIIKNKKNNNILFDEKLTQHEDCNHNIKVIMQKELYGYCKEAGYYYLKHDSSASSNNTAMYFSVENWSKAYMKYIKQYKNEENNVARYIQMILLYEISWRLKSHTLFITHLDEKRNNIFRKRIINLIKNIEDELILKCPHLDRFHKHFLISLKENDIEVIKKPLEVVVKSNNIQIASEKNFEIIITRFKTINNRLKISGFFKSVIYNYEKPKFYISIDNLVQELDVKSSTHSNYKIKRTKTNNFYAFDLNYDLNDVNEIKFIVKFENNEYLTKFYFMPDLVINSSVNRYLYIYKNNKIEVKNNKILIDIITEAKIEDIRKKEYKKFKTINRKINLYRYLTLKNQNKKIWLYNDKEGILDNAYYQYLNDYNKKDGIKRYYVINSKDYINFKCRFNKVQLKNVIKFNSFKHKLIFLQASKILTSFKNIELYSPFANKSLNWYKDLLKYELIYLQHGILHCHTPWIYSKEVTDYDKIVISSKFEYNNLIDNYNYNVSDFIMTGMPRFDNLITDNKKEKSNRILFAPSWRVNLMSGYKNGIYIPDVSKFLKSDFYIQINNFFKSKKLEKLLINNNITLEFSLHPIFKPYKNLFEFKYPNVKFVEANELNVNNYDLVITDYSSFVFDYVYLNIPVIYFVPDYTLYKAGVVHMYNKLDLTMEDGFGPFTTNYKDAIEELETYIKNGKSLKKYQNKANQFFIQKGNHCEALYQELIGDENV